MFKENELLGEYVSRMDEACGEGKEFIVTLKYSKRSEVLKRILQKCVTKQNLSGILIKGKFKDKEVSIFKTGKLVIREFQGRKEAETFLEDLIK
jgi:ribonuclease HIII